MSNDKIKQETENASTTDADVTKGSTSNGNSSDIGNAVIVEKNDSKDTASKKVNKTDVEAVTKVVEAVSEVTVAPEAASEITEKSGKDVKDEIKTKTDPKSKKDMKGKTDTKATTGTEPDSKGHKVGKDKKSNKEKKDAKAKDAKLKVEAQKENIDRVQTAAKAKDSDEIVSDNKPALPASNPAVANRLDLIKTDVGMLNKPSLLQRVTGIKQFAFWSTQPVPMLNEDITTNECIEADKEPKDILQYPYTLPEGFKWDTLDLNTPEDLKELYKLLNENYVEDDDSMFRFDYQPEFLLWSLQPPGWRRDWHVGVRVVKSNRLVGFISAIPCTLRVYEKELKMVEINFLCVHKKLRSKRVAPVLILEITRRVNLTGIFQAAYTAGVVLPKPVSTGRYWHRSLNPKKLIEVKFSYLARNMTMQRTMKFFKLPDTPKTKGFRRIEPKDMEKAHKLLNSYLKGFALSPIFSEDEFRHWFTPREGIVDCYIVENDGEITDLTSFYCLPSSVMHHPVHKSIRGAYSFYNVSTKTPWLELMNDSLISARNAQMDVFNALDLMENKKFLSQLKFGIGDGNLQYYLYNWRCPAMDPEKVALILM